MKALSLECILTSQCGTSSVGRASACQAEGRRFETGVPHQFQRNILFLLLFFIVSCGGGGSSDSSPNDSNNSNPIVTSISESCEITSWNNKLRRCDLTHDGLQRYYFIYVPDNLNNEKAFRCFLRCGYGSTARNHFSYTNYIPIADENKSYCCLSSRSSNEYSNINSYPIGMLEAGQLVAMLKILNL